MRISIYGHNCDVDSDVKEHVDRHLRYALSRLSNRILEVKVRLTDLNAHRGGVDKHCQIVVHLLPTGAIVVENVDASIHASVAHAAERTGRAVSRELQRRWQLSRQGPPEMRAIRHRSKSHREYANS